MENFSDSGSVTPICKSCGHVTTGTVKVSIATDLDIAGFNILFVFLKNDFYFSH